MQFTPFIPIDTSGGTLDPLSFLRPSGQLKDKLFKQFTLLSRHPAYHGALCWLFRYVVEKSGTTTQNNFSRRFREAELFWGLLNSHPDVATTNLSTIGQSVLNITKFETLHSKAVTAFAQAKRWGPLFARLNYGTLGHYAGPSRVWGLFDAKGQQLTAIGDKLGTCWGQRGTAPFGDLLEAWIAGTDIEDLMEAAMPYALGAPATAAEQECWCAIIAQYTACHPDRQPLWSDPLSEETLMLSCKKETYPSFFPALLEHYAQHPDLRIRIDLGGLFDAVAGLATLVFEWEYVRRLFDVNALPDYQDVENLIVQALPPLLDTLHTQAATQGFVWDLTEHLQHAATWDALANAVLQHHERHQHRKKVSPYIRDGVILIHNRVKPEPVVGLLGDIQNFPETLVAQCCWHYRRNWHFDKAALWRSYAGYTA